MHRYSRMHLSPEAAMRTIDAIDLEEKSRLAESIALIAVIDHRRDYLAAGCSCMRSYCMGQLRMSEDKALRRIQVARVALRFPKAFEYLADGRLSVTTAAVLAPHLTPETAASLLAERTRALPAALADPVCEPLVEPTSCQHAPVHVENARRGRATPRATGYHDVRLTITQSEHEDLRRAPALMRDHGDSSSLRQLSGTAAPGASRLPASSPARGCPQG